MRPNHTEQNTESPTETLIPRRTILRTAAGASTLGLIGIPAFSTTAGAAIPGVTIGYNRCRSAEVANASAVDALAVYYADRDDNRQAKYDVDPTTNVAIRGPPRDGEVLLVQYDADTDTTGIRLREPQGSLVCIIAEAGADRTVRTNPTEVCVPEGFNTAPTASFTTSADPTVGEPVTFTSTATDPDDPERLYYEWDLDGDGSFETSGAAVTTTFETPGEKTITHRVTDDCGATAVATQTIPVASSGLFEQVERLVAPDAAFGDSFGWAVSVDGDTAVVGANLQDPDGISTAGAAYVFTESGGSWTLQQKLTAEDAQSQDSFGYSVSIDGDTALVGAYLEDPDSKSDAGSAYVFTRSGGTWTQQQKLTAADAQIQDYFGVAVSVDGDTALVGASLQDPDGQSNAGAVYVFTRSGDTWTQQQKLTADDKDGSEAFGAAVSLDGDTALIGASVEDLGRLSDAGAAYVFTRSGATWAQQQKLIAEDAQFGDRFGSTVSVDGDTALIGAVLEDPDGISTAGAVYVFTRNGSTWTQQQKLTADDADERDRFGESVSVSADTALVGAANDNQSGLRSAGSAYVFTRSGSTWTQQQKLTAPVQQTGVRFGQSVSLDGDTALIGAYRETVENPDTKLDAGAAYVFSK